MLKIKKIIDRLIFYLCRVVNFFLEKASVLYYNKSSDYSYESYYHPLHLKKLNSSYGRLVSWYYRYIAKFSITEPAQLTKNKKILDIGCGVGILVQQLKILGYDATGVDVNRDAISHSVTPADCHLVETTANLNFENCYFDLIISREVLEHIPADSIDACIREWDRISKGKMIHIIAVVERGKSATCDPTHVNVKSENWWIEKFEQFNYRATKHPSPFFISPFGSKGYLMFSKSD